MEKLHAEEGYNVPVCLALTTPPLILGVPREMFILNFTIGLAMVMALGLWYLSIINLFLHFVIKTVSHKDPLLFTIYLKRYTKQKNFYNE